MSYIPGQKVVRTIIDKNANWEFNNPSYQPTPKTNLLVESSGGDRDAYQIRDQANNVLWWIDGVTGTPHFPNNKSGALPTPRAFYIWSIPGINPPNQTVFLFLDTVGNPLGWVNINPNGYGGTLASLDPTT